MFIERSLTVCKLHSHTFDANIRLFKDFIEKFIEIELKFKSNSKDDFIELHFSKQLIMDF